MCVCMYVRTNLEQRHLQPEKVFGLFVRAKKSAGMTSKLVLEIENHPTYICKGSVT
jgi:hypothetical protein